MPHPPRTHRLGLVVLSLIAIAPASLPAATYYLGNSGASDSNNGSASAPWKTFGKAAGVLVAGDTLLVYGGDYYPTSQQYFYKSGTSASRITIRSVDNQWATFYGSSIGSQANNEGILTIGGNYLTIKNMTFRNGKQIGLRFWSSSYCTVDSITAEYNQTGGIAMDGDYAQSNATNARNKNRNNTIQYCSVRYNCQSNSPLTASSWPSALSSYLGNSNTLYNNWSYGNYGEGILVNRSVYSVVKNNSSNNNHAANIYLDNCQNVEVKDNSTDGYVISGGLIWNGICNSAENYGSFELNPNANYIHHNTVKNATWPIIWVGLSGSGDGGTHWAERCASSGWYTGNTLTGNTNGVYVGSGNSGIVNGAKP